MDTASRQVVSRMNADLITQNRATQATAAALAESWTVSPDGKHYTIRLRKNVHFSDGEPFDADDVVFSIRLYLDEKTHAPQRDLLLIEGAPVEVRKVDQFTVVVDLPSTYATAERMFDGLAMLPRHLLQQSYSDGSLARAWGLNTPRTSIAGLGPFRLKAYQPGERIILERNPYYWNQGKPYLDEIEFLFVGDEDAQIARFIAGETDVINRLTPKNAALLQARRFEVEDAGPSLDYNFLFFNLTSNLPSPAKDWFEDRAFRQAVSLAIDRKSMVDLVYSGKATPLKVHVTPGNRMWVRPGFSTPPAADPKMARQILGTAGFKWNAAGRLLDKQAQKVEFTILVPSNSAERSQIATMVADDLKKIGIEAPVVSLEFRSMADRILKTHEYEAAIMGLGAGDGDPNSEMNVWLSSGSMHIWNPEQANAATAWEAEIDSLMRKQEVETNLRARQQLYWRVQEIEAEELPIISLVSPNVLAAKAARVRNFRPVILGNDILWNADELWLARNRLASEPAK
jgi:peptide/nickel transport system substrate-binding protein